MFGSSSYKSRGGSGYRSGGFKKKAWGSGGSYGSGKSYKKKSWGGSSWKPRGGGYSSGYKPRYGGGRSSFGKSRFVKRY